MVHPELLFARKAPPRKRGGAGVPSSRFGAGVLGEFRRVLLPVAPERQFLISLGNDRCTIFWPGKVELGVVPADPAFVVWFPRCGREVREQCRVWGHDAVRNTGWHVQRERGGVIAGRRVEEQTVRLTERRRPSANVKHDVRNAPRKHGDELPLAMLPVHASHRSRDRERGVRLAVGERNCPAIWGLDASCRQEL